ncbi:AAA family ATPase [Salmonella enterica]|nr:AAA family ATPase [Salmonella enterica]EDX9156861.1 AAA family ATPase [Salmonella enterica subsp. enterica serovar Sandiego]EIC7819415.1 AAA family ATPase [Salmonella enterica]EJH6881179.1 AAA family ATPase [Salmonella enterica]EJO3888291.1 AAA family ATPase [Salmonella enterica]
METPVSRSALYGKLAGPLFRSLESATAFCKLRSNPWVELTHWLHQLTQQPDNDILHVLRHYQIPLSDVEKALLRQLDMLPAGASAISDFSHHIDLSVEKAWMLASVRYGDNKIRSGWLLLALLTTPELRRVLSSICAPLATLPVDELTEILPSLIETSPEAQERPYDGSGLASTIPGESSQAIPNGGQDGKSALAKYCQDMTAQARDGKIDPVTGREHEIRTMTDILLRRRQNNPLLTGEAGVGKTAVVEGFALAIAQGEVPPALREVRLLALDVGALLAGASMKGEFESRLKGLLEEAGRSPQPVILFVDEVHTLVGAGGASGTGDAANLLKPALARGTLRTIGATTWSEYKRHIEKDPALTRRFQVLQIAEPEEIPAMEMVRGLVDTLEKHHNVLILDEAVRAAVQLSHRYIPARQLPDSDLISQMCEDPALMPDATGLKEALMPELRKHFPAAFLGRVTVIPYLPLDETSRGVIARLHLDRLVARMGEQHGVTLTYSEELVAHIVACCPMHETGARLLIGYIEQHILPRLSRYWLQAMTEKAAIRQIDIGVNGDEQIVFETTSQEGICQKS